MARLNVALPRALDLNANPSNGGKLYVYQAGTTTTVTTYSDVAMTTAQAHPVLADSAGNFPEVYVPEGDYKVIIKTSADVTLRQTDNVSVAARNSYKTLAELAASKVLGDGDYTTVFGGDNNEPETFKYVAASTLTANGTTVVAPTAVGVAGRYISTRTEYATVADLKADVRVFAVGTVLWAEGFRYDVVSSGEHLTNAGGAKLKSKTKGGMYSTYAVLSMDGATDDQSLLATLDASAVADGKPMLVTNGTALINSNITVAADLVFRRGGMLKPAAGVTITMAGEITAGARQIFDLSAGGSIKLTRTQNVKPEWVGDGASNVRTIMKSSAPGSRTVLRGIEYLIDYLHFDNSPDTEDGVDDGKTIVGTTAANRFTSPQTASVGSGSALTIPPANRTYKGTLLRFKTGETVPTDFVKVDSTYSVSSRTFSAIRLENLMLHGSAEAVNGLAIGAVKDLQLHNIYICGFTGDGVYTNAGSGGGNNQVNVTGFLEVFFNDGDGIKGAYGDLQSGAAIRSHHNGGKGVSITAGYINLNTLYAYANELEGIEWTNTSLSRITYLRSEDNGYEGFHYPSGADNLHIGMAMVPDNGSATGAATSRKVGIRNLGKNLRIDELVEPFRDNPEALASSGLSEQQLYTFYDGSTATGGVIGQMRDEAFEQAGKPAAARAILTDAAVRNGMGTKIGERRRINSTFANATANSYALFKQVDVYSLIKVDDVSFGFAVPNSDANASSHGMKMSLELTATAGATVTWGTDYLDSSGAAKTGVALTTGQTLSVTFVRIKSKWVQQAQYVA